MPQQVLFPGLGRVSFPDGMSPEDISTAAAQIRPDLVKRREASVLEQTKKEDLEQQKQELVGQTPLYLRMAMGNGVPTPEEAWTAAANFGRTALSGVGSLFRTTGRIGETIPPEGALLSDEFGNISPESYRVVEKETARRATETPQQRVQRVEANPLVQLGQGITRFGEEQLPRNEALSQSVLLGEVPSALASVGVSLAAAPLGPVGVYGTTFAQEFDGAYEHEIDRQKKAGEDPDPEKAAQKAAGYASIATAIEAKFGVGRILDRARQALRRVPPKLIDDAIRGAGPAVRHLAGELTKETVSGFGEELTQQAAEDRIVEGQVNWKNALHSGLIGALVQGPTALAGQGVNAARNVTDYIDTIAPGATRRRVGDLARMLNAQPLELRPDWREEILSRRGGNEINYTGSPFDVHGRQIRAGGLIAPPEAPEPTGTLTTEEFEAEPVKIGPVDQTIPKLSESDITRLLDAKNIPWDSDPKSPNYGPEFVDLTKRLTGHRHLSALKDNPEALQIMLNAVEQMTPIPRRGAAKRREIGIVPGEEQAPEERINQLAAIRDANATTLAQIQSLFPQANLSRQEARALRDQAWATPKTSESPSPFTGQFVTEFGSEYFVGPNGNSTRLKRSPGRGQGELHDTSPVVFISSEGQKLLTDNSGGKYRIILATQNADGTFNQIRPRSGDDIRGYDNLNVLSVDRQTGQIAAVAQASTNPELQKYPFEIFYKGDNKVYHLGNQITEITPVAVSQQPPTPPSNATQTGQVQGSVPVQRTGANTQRQATEAGPGNRLLTTTTTEQAQAPEAVPLTPATGTTPKPEPGLPAWITEGARQQVQFFQRTNPNLLEELTNLHAQDLTARQIAERLKISEVQVRALRLGLGLPDQGKGTALGSPTGNAEDRRIFEEWRDNRNRQLAERIKAGTRKTEPKTEPVAPTASSFESWSNIILGKAPATAAPGTAPTTTAPAPSKAGTTSTGAETKIDLSKLTREERSDLKQMQDTLAAGLDLTPKRQGDLKTLLAKATVKVKKARRRALVNTETTATAQAPTTAPAAPLLTPAQTAEFQKLTDQANTGTIQRSGQRRLLELTRKAKATANKRSVVAAQPQKRRALVKSTVTTQPAAPAPAPAPAAPAAAAPAATTATVVSKPKTVVSTKTTHVSEDDYDEAVDDLKEEAFQIGVKLWGGNDRLTLIRYSDQLIQGGMSAIRDLVNGTDLGQRYRQLLIQRGYSRSRLFDERLGRLRQLEAIVREKNIKGTPEYEPPQGMTRATESVTTTSELEGDAEKGIPLIKALGVETGENEDGMRATRRVNTPLTFADVNVLVTIARGDAGETDRERLKNPATVEEIGDASVKSASTFKQRTSNTRTHLLVFSKRDQLYHLMPIWRNGRGVVMIRPVATNTTGGSFQKFMENPAGWDMVGGKGGHPVYRVVLGDGKMFIHQTYTPQQVEDMRVAVAKKVGASIESGTATINRIARQFKTGVLESTDVLKGSRRLMPGELEKEERRAAPEERIGPELPSVYQRSAHQKTLRFFGETPSEVLPITHVPRFEQVASNLYHGLSGIKNLTPSKVIAYLNGKGRSKDPFSRRMAKSVIDEARRALEQAGYFDIKIHENKIRASGIIASRAITQVLKAGRRYRGRDFAAKVTGAIDVMVQQWTAESGRSTTEIANKFGASSAESVRGRTVAGLKEALNGVIDEALQVGRKLTLQQANAFRHNIKNAISQSELSEIANSMQSVMESLTPHNLQQALNFPLLSWTMTKEGSFTAPATAEYSNWLMLHRDDAAILGLRHGKDDAGRAIVKAAEVPGMQTKYSMGRRISNPMSLEQVEAEAMAALGLEDLPENITVIDQDMGNDRLWKGRVVFTPKGPIITLNARYIGSQSDILEALHEEGVHISFRDPEIASLVEQVNQFVTPEMLQAAREKGYDEDEVPEEAANELVRQITATAEGKTLWARLLDAVQRFIDKLFGGKAKTLDPKIAQQIMARALKYTKGEAKLPPIETQMGSRMELDRFVQRQLIARGLPNTYYHGDNEFRIDARTLLSPPTGETAEWPESLADPEAALGRNVYSKIRDEYDRIQNQMRPDTMYSAPGSSRLVFGNRGQVEDIVGTPGLSAQQRETVESAASTQAGLVPQDTVVQVVIWDNSGNKVENIAANLLKPLTRTFALTGLPANYMGAGASVINQLPENQDVAAHGVIHKDQELKDLRDELERTQDNAHDQLQIAVKGLENINSANIESEFTHALTDELLERMDEQLKILSSPKVVSLTSAKQTELKGVLESLQYNKAVGPKNAISTGMINIARNIPESVLIGTDSVTDNGAVVPSGTPGTTVGNQSIINWVKAQHATPIASKEIVDWLTTDTAAGPSPLAAFKDLPTKLRELNVVLGDLSEATKKVTAFKKWFFDNQPKQGEKANRVTLRQFANKYSDWRNQHREAASLVRSLNREVRKWDELYRGSGMAAEELDRMMTTDDYQTKIKQAVDQLGASESNVSTTDSTGKRYAAKGPLADFTPEARFLDYTPTPEAAMANSMNSATIAKAIDSWLYEKEPDGGFKLNAGGERIPSAVAKANPASAAAWTKEQRWLVTNSMMHAMVQANYGKIGFRPFGIPSQFMMAIGFGTTKQGIKRMLSRQAMIAYGKTVNAWSQVSSRLDEIFKDKEIGWFKLQEAIQAAAASHPKLNIIKGEEGIKYTPVLNKILARNQSAGDVRLEVGDRMPNKEYVTAEDWHALQLMKRNMDAVREYISKNTQFQELIEAPLKISDKTVNMYRGEVAPKYLLVVPRTFSSEGRAVATHWTNLLNRETTVTDDKGQEVKLIDKRVAYLNEHPELINDYVFTTNPEFLAGGAFKGDDVVRKAHRDRTADQKVRKGVDLNFYTTDKTNGAVEAYALWIGELQAAEKNRLQPGSTDVVTETVKAKKDLIKQFDAYTYAVLDNSKVESNEAKVENEASPVAHFANTGLGPLTSPRGNMVAPDFFYDYQAFTHTNYSNFRGKALIPFIVRNNIELERVIAALNQAIGEKKLELKAIQEPGNISASSGRRKLRKSEIQKSKEGKFVASLLEMETVLQAAKNEHERMSVNLAKANSDLHDSVSIDIARRAESLLTLPLLLTEAATLNNTLSALFGSTLLDTQAGNTSWFLRFPFEVGKVTGRIMKSTVSLIGNTPWAQDTFKKYPSLFGKFANLITRWIQQEAYMAEIMNRTGIGSPINVMEHIRAIKRDPSTYGDVESRELTALQKAANKAMAALSGWIIPTEVPQRVPIIGGMKIPGGGTTIPGLEGARNWSQIVDNYNLRQVLMRAVANTDRISEAMRISMDKRSRGETKTDNWDNGLEPLTPFSPEELGLSSHRELETFRRWFLPAGNLEAIALDYWKRYRAAPDDAAREKVRLLSEPQENSVWREMMQYSGNPVSEANRVTRFGATGFRGAFFQTIFRFGNWNINMASTYNSWLEQDLRDKTAKQLWRILKIFAAMLPVALVVILGGEVKAMARSAISNDEPSMPRLAGVQSTGDFTKLAVANMAAGMIPYYGEWMSRSLGTSANRPLLDMTGAVPLAGIIASGVDTATKILQSNDPFLPLLDFVRNSMPYTRPIIGAAERLGIEPFEGEAASRQASRAVRSAAPSDMEKTPTGVGGTGGRLTPMSGIMRRAIDAAYSGNDQELKSQIEKAVAYKVEKGQTEKDARRSVLQSLESKVPTRRVLGKLPTPDEEARIISRMTGSQQSAYEASRAAFQRVSQATGHPVPFTARGAVATTRRRSLVGRSSRSRSRGPNLGGRNLSGMSMRRRALAV